MTNGMTSNAKKHKLHKKLDTVTAPKSLAQSFPEKRNQ